MAKSGQTKLNTGFYTGNYPQLKKGISDRTGIKELISKFFWNIPRIIINRSIKVLEYEEGKIGKYKETTEKRKPTEYFFIFSNFSLLILKDFYSPTMDPNSSALPLLQLSLVQNRPLAPPILPGNLSPKNFPLVIQNSRLITICHRAKHINNTVSGTLSYDTRLVITHYVNIATNKYRCQLP